MDASVNETSMLGQRTVFEARAFVTVALRCWRSCSGTPPSLYKTGDPPKSAPSIRDFFARKSEVGFFSLGIEKEYRELAFSGREFKKKIGKCQIPIFFPIPDRKLSTSDFLFQFPMRKREIPTFFFDSQLEKANSRYSFSIPGRKKRISGFLFHFPIGKRQILIGNRKFRSGKAKFRFAFQERSLQSRPDVL
jgi:hypothetical protein